jgi:hypothetical protein
MEVFPLLHVLLLFLLEIYFYPTEFGIYENNNHSFRKAYFM